MPRGRGRNRGRGGGRPISRRGRRGQRSSVTYRPRKRPWESDESDSEEFVVTDNETDNYDDNDFSPIAKSSQRKHSGFGGRQIASTAGLEEEDEEVEFRYFDERDLEESSNYSRDENEFIVDISDSEDAHSDASSIRHRRRGRPANATRCPLEPVRCVWMDERPDLQSLDLPPSSQDLLLPNGFILRALEIYEICRRFGPIVKLSPFLFEDFCACLSSRDQSPLLDEIHVALLRSLLKDDETAQVTLGPADVRDSINISIHLLDHYTYGELIRRYVESDERFPDYGKVLDALSGTDYPFVDVEKRLNVLGWLSGQFMGTQALRTELAGEGVIQHEDHCRECGKPGDLLCCDTCSAVYHMDCCNPPVCEPPSSGWQCEICTIHDVRGIYDCRSNVEKGGQLIRHDILGYDRHGRRYSFLVRRIFVEDETTGDVHYYSSLAQIHQLLSMLDDQDLEQDLCEAIVSIGNLLIVQTSITQELTQQRFDVARRDCPSQKMPYLMVDKEHRRGEENNKAVGKTDLKKWNIDADTSRDSEDIHELINQMDIILATVHVELEDCNPSRASPSTSNGSKMTRSRTGHLPKSRLSLAHTGKDYLLNDSQAVEPIPNPNAVDSSPQNDSLAMEGHDDKDQSEIVSSTRQSHFHFDPGPFFKLGQDREFLRYNNQYTSNPLSKSPYLRAEERNRSKYISNRFLMEDEGDFTWPLDLATTADHVIRMLKSSITKTTSRIPAPLIHPHLSSLDNLPCWRNNLLNPAKDASQIASCLAVYEAHMRPVLFSETYRHNLGHTKLCRLTAEDREERQRKEKQRRKDASERSAADPANEATSLVWVKYSLFDGPPKHQIWKLRDEAYRVNGDGQLGGWIWMRKTRPVRWVETATAGLSTGPVWECAHGPIIDQLLMDVQNGHLCEENEDVERHDDPTTYPTISSPVSGFNGSLPLCAELPMEFDENTATFQVNRSKAITHLNLHQHTDSIDVSLGLIQHTIYYKLAKRSRCLDRLLLYRMKQEDDEQRKDHLRRKAEAKDTLLKEAAWNNVCYSADCRRFGDTASCYSTECRRKDTIRATTMKEDTCEVHRLRLPQTEQSGNASKVWEEDSSSVPPAPQLVTFRPRKSPRKTAVNVLLLPSYVLKTLGRKAGIQETIEGFNHTAKSSAHVWPYPCFRPTFQTCWRYHLQKAESLHAVALLFRILYHNIRWDQLSISRDLEATYVRRLVSHTEQRVLCGHRYLPPYGLRIQYRVQMIKASNALVSSRTTDMRALTISSDESNEEEEKEAEAEKGITPRQNAPWSLRERKTPRRPRTKNFEKYERWLDDDALTLWEMKNYWTRRERTNRIPPRVGDNGRNKQRFGGAQRNSTPLAAKFSDDCVVIQQDGAQPLTVLVPPPNTSVTLNLGGGNRIRLSNKPHVPGGPCVVTAEALPPVTTTDPPNGHESSLGNDRSTKTMKLRNRNDLKRRFISPEYQSDESLDEDDDSVADLDGSRSITGQDGEIERRYEDTTPSSSRSTKGRSSGRVRRRTAFEVNPPGSRMWPQEDKDRYQACKIVLSRVIQQVTTSDTLRQREELNSSAKKSRIQYWRDYRIKRKAERMKAGAITNRMEKWTREITKRRETVKATASTEIRRHFNGTILEKVTTERTLLGWPQPNRSSIRMVTPAPSVSSQSDPPERKRPRVQEDAVPQQPVVVSNNQREKRERRKKQIYSPPTKERRTTVLEKNRRREQTVQEKIQTAQNVERGTAKSEELHCICRTLFDPTKFYVMCDLCGRWFHGKCVGINQRKSKQMTTWSCHECQKAKELAKQELYCICQTPYDESKPYVCCDSCDGWYHCNCVGISSTDADTLPSFICPNCSGDQTGDTVTNAESMESPSDVSPISVVTKRLDRDDYQQLVALTNGLVGHQMSWPFRHGVDRKKHPLYQEIIKNRIDLSIINGKVNRREYGTLSEYSQDVVTIFNNARSYYPVDTPEFQCATVLDQYFTKELRHVKQAIASSVSDKQRDSSMNWNGNV